MQPFLLREARIHEAKDAELYSSHQLDARRFDESNAIQIGGEALGLNFRDSAGQIGLAEGRAAKGQAGHLSGQEAGHQVGGLLFARRNLACGVGQIAGVKQEGGASRSGPAH